MTKKVIFTAVTVVVLVLIGIGVYTRGFGYWEEKGSASWRAVFLANGQVYFGHIEHGWSGKTVVLKDIYYLQVDQQENLQPDKTNSSDESKLSLVKLGNELHGPVDKMEINRDQVLFVEELKSDSKVVSAINDYQKTQ